MTFDQVPGVELFDAHTHVGQNDPDGMKQTPEQLLEGLTDGEGAGGVRVPDARARRVPGRQRRGDRAARQTDGLLFPSAGWTPHEAAVAEAERCLPRAPAESSCTREPRGSRSITPRSADRRARPRANAADAHPCRPRDPRARPARRPARRRVPEARLILAHAAICDLAWIWRVAPDHPNLLFDTAWWMPADIQSLFSLVPPGQILFASDAPYGNTAMSAAFMLRLRLQVGLSTEQIRSIACEQAVRVAAGEALVPAGPAIGERERAPHLLLDRVASFLLLGDRHDARHGADEMLALARLACDVPDGDRRRPRVRSDPGLLDAATNCGRPRRPPPARLPDPRRDGGPDARRPGPAALAHGRRPASPPPLPSRGCAARSAAARSG